MRCERGLLTRADGSAQWTQGGTACLASVTGPTQSYASSKEDAERATVDVVFRPRGGLAGALPFQKTGLLCCRAGGPHAALTPPTTHPCLQHVGATVHAASPQYPAVLHQLLLLAGALERQYDEVTCLTHSSHAALTLFTLFMLHQPGLQVHWSGSTKRSFGAPARQ